MANKITISIAGNVLVPAYLTLVEKGYLVTFKKDGGNQAWFAENDDCRFIADDPVSLLGLISMLEIRGKSWEASDELINDFLEKYDQTDQP